MYNLGSMLDYLPALQRRGRTKLFAALVLVAQFGVGSQEMTSKALNERGAGDNVVT